MNDQANNNLLYYITWFLRLLIDITWLGVESREFILFQCNFYKYFSTVMFYERKYFINIKYYYKKIIFYLKELNFNTLYYLFYLRLASGTGGG